MNPPGGGFIDFSTRLMWVEPRWRSTNSMGARRVPKSKKTVNLAGLLPLRLQEPVGDNTRGPKEDCDEQGRQEALDGNALNHRAHEPDHQAIDDKEEKAERDEGHRKREDYENWSDNSVQQTKDECSNNCSVEVCHVEAGNKLRSGQEHECRDQPAKQKFHHSIRVIRFPSFQRRGLRGGDFLLR